MPAASAMRATAAPLRCARSQPVRVLSVTGTPVPCAAATTASRIRPTRGSSCNKAEPQRRLQTFFAGQPMLMSMICAPRSMLRRAASASAAGSAPANCTTRGSGSPSWSMRWRDLREFQSLVSEVIISEAASAAPRRRARMRNGRSVTPAMGASTAGAEMGQRPMRNAGGRGDGSVVSQAVMGVVPDRWCRRVLDRRAAGRRRARTPRLSAPGRGPRTPR